MNSIHRRIAVALAGAALVVLPASQVLAQGWPTKPVTLVNNWPPGGPSDILARSVGAVLQETFKQPFVVDNRAGAGGNIGAGLVAKAAADGYTLLFGIDTTFTVNPHLYPSLPFAPGALKPVIIMASSGLLIGVNTSTGINSFGDLLSRGRQKTLNFSSGGNGSPGHLAVAILSSSTPIRITHVPYKGSSQIVPDLIAGTVPMSMESSLATTLPHVRSGKLKAIAVTSARRAKALPEVPTVAESGYAGFEVETWFGLIAPAATPAAIVSRLQGAWAEGSRGADAQSAFDNISANLRVTTPAEFGAFIQAEHRRWGELIRKLGIKAD